MRRVLISASALSLSAGMAVAGGVERSAGSVGILFEQGNYAELTYGFVNPTVEGVFMGAIPSGDMASSYSTFSLGVKQSLNDRLDFALILDQPIGANVSYPAAAAPYPFAGSTADVNSAAVTGLVRYKLPSNFSVYGGIKAESVSGDVRVTSINHPLLGTYTMSTDKHLGLGYVVGAAWEKPEIAARVALTYTSEITHSLASTEFGVVPGTFDTTVPQSVNLDFQTGVAANTLVFGSIRWVDWSVFDITPNGTGTPIALVDYDDDVITYNLGVGRKFNENWSGAVTLGYEKSGGDPVGNLGPTDGYKSIGLAATYTKDNMKITGGVRYVDIGDATTSTIGAQFSGNSAIGAGIRVGFSF